jgi:hypothetical protein
LFPLPRKHILPLFTGFSSTQNPAQFLREAFSTRLHPLSVDSHFQRPIPSAWDLVTVSFDVCDDVNSILVHLPASSRGTNMSFQLGTYGMHLPQGLAYSTHTTHKEEVKERGRLRGTGGIGISIKM